MDSARLGVNFQRQELHETDEVRFGPPTSHLHLKMTAFGFHRDKQVSCSSSLIFVILLGNLPWSRRQRPAGLFQQLFTLFIQADHWLGRIVRGSSFERRLILAELRARRPSNRHLVGQFDGKHTAHAALERGMASPIRGPRVPTWCPLLWSTGKRTTRTTSYI